MIQSGVSARVFSQECFTAPPELEPPLRITRVGYHVAATLNSPHAPRLTLRRFVDGAPTPIDDYLENIAAPVSVGYHSVDVDWEIDATSFCVGLVGGAMGTALGIGTDEEVVLAAGQAFYAILYSSVCPSFDYIDVALSPQVALRGPWCIDVEIEPA